MSTETRTSWWVAWAALALTVLRLWLGSQAAPAVDFFVVWFTAREAAQEEAAFNPYTDGWRTQAAQRARDAWGPQGGAVALAAVSRVEVRATGTPLLYALARPLAALEYSTALAWFRALEMLGVLLGLWWVVRGAGASAAAAAVVVALAGTWAGPLQKELQVGNISGLQTGLVACILALRAAGSRRENVFSGALLAVLFCVKPTAAAVLPALLLWTALRKPRAVLKEMGVGVLVGGGVSFVLGALLMGPASWVHYLDVLPYVQGLEHPLAEGNVSIPRMLEEHQRVHLSLVPLAVVLAAGSILLMARARNVSMDGTQEALLDVMVCTLALCLPLLTGNLVWSHYTLVLLPSHVLMAAPRRVMPGSSPVLGTLALMLGMGFPALVLMNAPGPWDTAVVAAACHALTFGLAAAVLWNVPRLHHLTRT